MGWTYIEPDQNIPPMEFAEYCFAGPISHQVFGQPIDYQPVLMDVLNLREDKYKTIHNQLFEIFEKTFEKMEEKIIRDRIELVAETLGKSEDRKLLKDDLIKLLGKC